jgi:hypothetical protein
LNIVDALPDTARVDGTKTCSTNKTDDIPKTTVCGTMIAEAANIPTPMVEHELAEVGTNCTEAIPDDESVDRIAPKPTSTTEANPFAENTPIKLETNETFVNPWTVSTAGSKTCSLNIADALPDNATVHGTKTCSLNTTVDVPTIEHCGTTMADADANPTPEGLNELTWVEPN